ncbi:MAG: hypothetical protein IT215_05545, partial [Chitinophagaceae bacterium]|nr:hypothetical protein [Chitinophagaceae bacterium]
MKNTKKMMCKIEKNNIGLTKPFTYFLDTLNSLPYSKITITDCDGITGEGEIVHAIDA